MVGQVTLFKTFSGVCGVVESVQLTGYLISIPNHKIHYLQFVCCSTFGWNFFHSTKQEFFIIIADHYQIIVEGVHQDKKDKEENLLEERKRKVERSSGEVELVGGSR